MSLKDKTVGFLGAGNMGEAIIKGLLQTGLVPTSAIAATDARADRLEQMASQYGIRAAASNRDLVAESDVVILAVKPQIMGAVLKEIAGAVDRSRLLISVAGGLATYASFPPVDAWPLAVAGPALLVVALTGRSLRGSVGCGHPPQAHSSLGETPPCKSSFATIMLIRLYEP